jgi:hypothetical protein
MDSIHKGVSMNSLLESAVFYNSAFGFNVVPVHGMQPAVIGTDWQLKEQLPGDIAGFGWGAGVSGIGGVCGINEIRCLSFHKVSNPKIVTFFCADLRLKPFYRWIVKGGDGFQIWIKVNESESLINKLNGLRNTYRLVLKNPDLCTHIELKWSHSHALLPFSVDNAGNRYSFLNGEPRTGPVKVDPERLLESLEEFCNFTIEKEIIKSGRRAFQNEDYDRRKLESAIDWLRRKLPATAVRERNLIAGGLSTIGEEGRAYFYKLCFGSGRKEHPLPEMDEIFDSMRKLWTRNTTLETVYKIAEKYGWEKPQIIFWKVESGALSVSRNQFKKFLEENGFCKQKLGRGYKLLHVEKNIVHETEIFDIKDFVIDYIKIMDDLDFTGTSKQNVIAALIDGASQFFTQTFIEFLETRKLQFMRDTKDRSFLFFSNCYLEISRSGLQIRKYEELQFCIWDKQIIRRPFRISNKESEFARFIKNICLNNEKRILSLRSAIGYLLHNFKDSANAKAVIFLDEKLAEGAYGRSGKGLVAQSIGKLRKTVRLDGRNFNFSKNFSFQSVTPDTAVIEFNDASKKFNFDKLFAIITDDITVEKKNKDEIIIPFMESPKIIISTNYTIPGSDDSTLDRQFVIEFSDHYNKSHRPIDEFGHRFFDEWNDLEWNSFFNFMTGCIRLYLKKGFIKYGFINLEKKKLIDATSPEFARFFEALRLDKTYSKQELFKSFSKNFEEFSDIPYKKFSKWLNDGSKIKGYEIIEQRLETGRIIKFVSINE